MADESNDWFGDAWGSIKELGSGGMDWATSPEGVKALGIMGLSYLGNKSGIGDDVVPPTGYQGGIPDLTAVRQRVPQQDSVAGEERRPGSGGRRYFTDTQYAVPTNSGRVTEEAARAQSAIQAAALARANAGEPEPGPEGVQLRASGGVVRMAQGGLAGIAMKEGKYLNGSSDGMADEVPANIDGTQPAALSDGEFVIPADVVSHLGNGNSDAGAKVLSEMMSRIRKQRTGNDKQGKEIDPRKIIPA